MQLKQRIEKIRESLERLIESGEQLNYGELLALSQELDLLILEYQQAALKKKKESGTQ